MRTTRVLLLDLSRTVALVTVATVTLAACSGTSTTGASGSASASGSVLAGGAGDGKTVTVYSADGLGDWYKTEFKAFTARTGINVEYVEAGSGEVVSRIAKEKSNPQADVLVTLPPFIQQAKAQGLLQTNAMDTTGIDAAKRDKGGAWAPLVDNYFMMIRSTSVKPAPTTWKDLLAPRFGNKLQYSTPGHAGDGTAMLVLLEQVMGKDKAMSYLGALQKNNVGPSSSTGKLGPKVSSAELFVANSDLQMAQLAIKNSKAAYETFVPATDDGKRATISLPYAMGVVSNAPHREAAVKLTNFLLSREVQQTVPAGAMGLPVRSDVTATGPAAATLSKAMAGVTVIQPDWDTVSKNLGDDLAAYQKATNQ